MVKKFTLGNPFNTEAVVKPIAGSEGILPYLNREKAGVFSYQMGEKDIVYGLGQNARGINKRGWIYESRCSDEPFHTESKRSLYAAHNFIIVQGEELFGLFIDYPGILTFDIGYTKPDELVITASEEDMDIYVIDGTSPYDIVKQFRGLIGRSYIPPKWAFGYTQSRWSYMNEEEVREVVRGHRENHIPLDGVYLDIDYMERFKDFTVDEQTFPDFADFVEEMKQEGVRLIPIIDAGVKMEDGYSVYEEGREKGYFCKNEDGSQFVAGVWPGRVGFPDFLNKEARDWFGDCYKVLLDQGIEGFWNDMNEPAIFYSEEHLQEVFDKIDEYKNMNLDVNTFFEFQQEVAGLSNSDGDLKRFYHEVDGESIRHDKVHNLYGYNMTRAAGEAFERLEPDKRILMFSRSSYIGMHRYGGIWTGDNLSWWSHILLNLKMMPSLNMCGILYTGADIGGFGDNTTEDLMLRWLALGIFTPLLRNHSARGTREQEVYQFEQTDAFRNIIGLRYGLLPYLYSEFMKAAINDDMYFLPLAFVYPEDERAVRTEDQLFVGKNVMIAPVYEQNADGRYVYLPEEMKMIKFRSLADREEIVLERGHHYIEIALDEVVIFIRPDGIIPCSTGGETVAEIDEDNLFCLEFVKEKASYELYQDDGFSKDYENPGHIKIIEIVK